MSNSNTIIISLLYTAGHFWFIEQRRYVHLGITKITSHSHLWTSKARTLISPQPTDIPLLQIKDGKRLFPLTSNVLMFLICLRFGSGKKNASQPAMRHHMLTFSGSTWPGKRWSRSDCFLHRYLYLWRASMDFSG